MNPVTEIDTRPNDALSPYSMHDGLVAMQYDYQLPADYDMTVIRQRITTNAARMKDFPHLIFKSFAYSANDYAYRYSQTNSYAPLYLWRNYAGPNQLLLSEGFKALTQAFGWPVIRTWSVVFARLRESFAIASWAAREIIAIKPFSDLDELRLGEAEQLNKAIAAKHILGGIVAIDPLSWTLLRYTLFATHPGDKSGDARQIYQIGNMAV